MKGLVFDGKGFKELKTDGENNLIAWYKAIDCDCIDIVSRKVGGKYLEIVLRRLSKEEMDKTNKII